MAAVSFFAGGAVYPSDNVAAEPMAYLRAKFGHNTPTLQTGQTDNGPIG